MRKRCPSPEPPFTPPDSPNKAPVNKDAAFPKTSFHFLSQFLVNGLPLQVPQRVLYGERDSSPEPSSTNPLKIHLSLRVTVREIPPCSPTISLWREILRLQSQWSNYSFTYVCQIPQKKEPSYKMGKNIRPPSREPHADGRPTYNGGRPGSPRGWLTTLLFLSQYHAALGAIPSTLVWVEQSPVSQRVS